MELLHAIPWDQLLIQTINGIVTGMILALVASGLTLMSAWAVATLAYGSGHPPISGVAGGRTSRPGSIRRTSRYMSPSSPGRSSFASKAVPERRLRLTFDASESTVSRLRTWSMVFP